MMKMFLLNLTKIIENNAKIYASIIVGLVGCLLLLIAEAVHIQSVVTALATDNQTILKEAIRPLTQRYNISRYFLIVVALVWSIYEYKTTKRKMGL